MDLVNGFNEDYGHLSVPLRTPPPTTIVQMESIWILSIYVFIAHTFKGISWSSLSLLAVVDGGVGNGVHFRPLIHLQVSST